MELHCRKMALQQCGLNCAAQRPLAAWPLGLGPPRVSPASWRPCRLLAPNTGEWVQALSQGGCSPGC